MRAFILLAVLCAGCDRGEGERCNPLQYSNSGTAGDCGESLSCIYPTAPTCGVAYCCKVDSNGNVIDSNPNCQPDPSLASVCMVDLSVPAPSDLSVSVDASVLQDAD
jgi:hypothetical protein